MVSGARLVPVWWVQKKMEAVSDDDIDIEYLMGQYGTIQRRRSTDIHVNCRRAYSLPSDVDDSAGACTVELVYRRLNDPVLGDGHGYGNLERNMVITL